MIKITDKHNCCGCEACTQHCPKQCITMTFDDEGFLYPKADENLCINCGICEKVCPVINLNNSRKPLNVYGTINPDENIRRKSSSGGIFTAIATRVIAEGGVVFGALFNDNWEVVHGCVERTEDLYKLRGSKYVQSRIGTVYQEVEVFLTLGRKVLFSGTSCQVAGLKKFLRKEYDNLLAVDVVCHGVPSPKIWKEYIRQFDKESVIEEINFRDKTSGWVGYSFSIRFADGCNVTESHFSNLYMQGFLQNLYLRPSCHNCGFKEGKSGSDITLGDLWGKKIIPTRFDDNLGVSVVLANTCRGKSIINELHLDLNDLDYSSVVNCNPCIVKATPEPRWRSIFMKSYQNGNAVAVLQDIVKRVQPTLLDRLIRRIKRVLFS